MNKAPYVKQFLHKLGGYYLIPHELLHVWAYRIINKPYHYQWGAYQVKALSKNTRRERLFIILFPFVVCWLIAFLFFMLWLVALVLIIKMPLEQYFLVVGPGWPVALPIIGTLFIFYSGTAHRDLMRAYQILIRKDKSSQNSGEPHPSTIGLD